MSQITILILIAIGAYLLGSVSGSIVFSNAVFNKDIRKKGSGNAGATNMARVFGAIPGIITLLIDIAKAVLSVWLGAKFAGEAGLLVAGIFCIVGHCFPIFYNFKGGKGVAVGIALAFAIDWRIGGAAVIAFAISFVVTKRVSLGSILGCVAAIAMAIFVSYSPERMALAFFASLLIIYQHRANIQRLVTNTEPEFRVGNTPKRKWKIK